MILNVLKLIVHQFPCCPPQEVKGSQVQDDVQLSTPSCCVRGGPLYIYAFRYIKYFLYMHLYIKYFIYKPDGSSWLKFGCAERAFGSLWNQLEQEHVDCYFFLFVSVFALKCDLITIFLMSQNKTSIFLCAVYIHRYLEKYIKNKTKRAKWRCGWHLAGTPTA